MFDPEVLKFIPRMDKLRVLDADIGSQEWLDARNEGVGGSEIAAVLGLTKWSSPLQLWRRKMGLDPDIKANWKMIQGNAMEGPIADTWAEANDVDIYKVPMLVDIEKPWRRVNLDRIAVPRDGRPPFVVEIKFSGEAYKWVDVPIYYYTQVLWQMAMTGLVVPAAFVFAGANDEPRSIPVPHDAELADGVGVAIDSFWHENVETGIAPEPTTSEEVMTDAISKVTKGTSADATSEATVIADRLRVIRDTVKELDTEKTELSSNMSLIMAQLDVAKLKGADWSASAITKAGGISYSAVVKELCVSDEILEKHRGKDSSYVMCRFKD